jgi:6-phosphogluconate dehydrogenase
MEVDMFIIVMGVSGCGKTTIGKLLAEKIGCDFYDGDDFHPPENLKKMAAGTPLSDADRFDWLKTLVSIIMKEDQQGKNGVMACSALKEKYRVMLRVEKAEVKFVYLKGSYDLIYARMQTREDHYMKPAMLKSQFETLEEPKDALVEDISRAPEVVVNDIVETLNGIKYQLGIIGLGVMGRNLAMNFMRNGYRVLGYDISPQLPANLPLRIANDLEHLCLSLEKPRVILVMVPAGAPVDQVITSLSSFLQPGDILIDGGNSYYEDTGRRLKKLARQKIRYIGMGVSGGESGALYGPSLMPGGDRTAWEVISPMLKVIAAKTDEGIPCVDWMGAGGAGHYVKMVHNGIEYADMQLIAEIYDLLHRGAGISNAELAEVFSQWNRGVLHSYLIEITAKILSYIDTRTGQPLIDLIVDEAAQKGTGKWASQSSFDVGVAIPTINAAVESRLLSSIKKERIEASKVLGVISHYSGGKAQLIDAAESALYASKLTSYAQGLSLLQSADRQNGWGIDLGKVTRVWQAGCIIRASVLQVISSALISSPNLPNLLMDRQVIDALMSRQKAWREVVKSGVDMGIPMLATCASLSYFDAYRSETLPANLIQAQRDYFGAHHYRRTDDGTECHTDWEKFGSSHE